ncbi:MAG TPA: metal-binding protein [Pirellulaceae bacterium]|nr:metal-binding protein [Pirellulaceae bacterium]
MQVQLSYYRHSALLADRLAQTLSFAPNLARDPVAFDGALKAPVRFREAISALHDVVISDLRYKPRDKTAYEEWKKSEQQRLSSMRKEAYQQAKTEILARRGDVSPDIEARFERCRRRYWHVRQAYSDYLRENDWDLWRRLMPCDPVVTVADDVVFFECFSADESSYGCLTVDRGDGFGSAAGVKFGTTNVDYSWDLYHHFQALRSYRQTRFQVDPQGFEVATVGNADYREEKIDLPAGWLRGFMQIQVAMGLPTRRVRLSREAVYSILAWLKRHKAHKSPRAIRFELDPGQSPRIVLEPWEQLVVSHGTKYDGPSGEPTRIWGSRRLLSLARALPLVDYVDVHLLGTGMPSFWLAQLGEMRLTLGISGWTTNDWTRGSALDLLVPPGGATSGQVARAAELLRHRGALSFDEIQLALMAQPVNCALAMNFLARTGQVIYDLGARKFRWRQIMPQVLGEADIGPENEELTASRVIVARRRVTIDSQQSTGTGLMLYTGKADGKPVELLMDADGMIKRGKCLCGHHQKAGIRMGPCRHLLALRQTVLEGPLVPDVSALSWYDRLKRWGNN